MTYRLSLDRGSTAVHYGRKGKTYKFYKRPGDVKAGCDFEDIDDMLFVLGKPDISLEEDTRMVLEQKNGVTKIISVEKLGEKREVVEEKEEVVEEETPPKKRRRRKKVDMT